MRKMLLILLMLLLALTGCARREAAEEASVWAACDAETGLWGYVDAKGAWVLSPAYAAAEDFTGGCAAVMAQSGRWGLIDRQGGFVLAAEHDTVTRIADDLFLVGTGGMYGWYCAETGFFSGIAWDDVLLSGVTPYVAASQQGIVRFYDSRSGAPASEAGYAAQWYAPFAEGNWALDLVNEDRLLLLDAHLQPIPYPEDAWVDYPGYGGLICFGEEDVLLGYMNARGETVIAPQYIMAESFWGPYATVVDAQERVHLIDTQGRVLASDMLYHASDVAGNAVVSYGDHTSVLRPDGSVLFTLPHTPGQMFTSMYEVGEKDLWWYAEMREPNEMTFGVLSKKGEIIVPACWEVREEELTADGQGWIVVRDPQTRQEYYVNRRGERMLPDSYSQAAPFRGELARVTRDGQRMLINRRGECVRAW